MANKTGLARSTLSKIENGQMSPTFDLLQKLAAGVETDVSSLVASPNALPPLGRRSITRAGQGSLYETANYRHAFLCVELTHKKFTALRTKVTARSFSEFPEWVRHPGEDFVFVLDGEVEFFSELYQPTRLLKGDSTHFDSMMGHAFISVSPDDAEILWVTAS